MDSWKNSDPPDLTIKLFKRDLNVEWGSVGGHVDCGLLNYGSTCYINATVQSSNLAEKLCAVIDSSLKLDKQEDASEFLLSSLNKIASQEIERHPVKLSYCIEQTSGIHSLFGFWMKRTKSCCGSGCNFKSTVYSSHLNLLISTSENSVQKGVNQILYQKEALYDYECPGCLLKTKEKQSCLESCEFYTCPKILIIVVDRFADPLSDLKDESPVVLNRSVKIGKATYTLQSCIIHHGSFRTGGHFTSAAACPDGSHAEFDDLKVSKNSNVLQRLSSTKGVFILFYQQDLKKRPRPDTPSKFSPAHKKWRSPLEKRLHGGNLHHLSKKGPVKKFITSRSVLRRPKEGDTLAEPLKPDLDAQELMPKIINTRLQHSSKTGQEDLSCQETDSESTTGVTKKVRPITILRSKRVTAKDTASQSSNEYAVATNNMMDCQPAQETDSECSSIVTKRILPITILRNKRVTAKDSASQSSNEYAVRKNVIDSQPAQETDSESTTGVTKKVHPITILRSKRLTAKDSASQSSNEYSVRKNLFDAPVSQDDLGFDNAATNGLKPLTNLSNNRLAAKDTASQSFNEYSTLSLNDLLVSPLLYDDILNDEENPLDSSSSDILDEDLHDDTSEHSSFLTSLPPKVPYYIEDGIELSESDVPGARLPEPIIEKNTVRDLKRWLVCHGQKQQGNKTVFISKITKCMKDAVPVTKDVDKGVWLRKKMDRHRMAYNVQCSQVNFPESGFDTFPSKDLPESFNFGSIFHYLIESRPMTQFEDSSSDDDVENVTEVQMKDPFEDPKCKEFMRAKLLRRGLQYVKSGWVKGMQDCTDDRYHYIKAHVRASMDACAYWVYITISKITGGVCQVTCGYPCPATANGRCSHVSAALLQILAHIHLNGYGCK